jgi:REP element-mobilizing transposase RayT
MAMRCFFAHNSPFMPVCLFTFHAYRSWRVDNPKGYVQRGQAGVQPPSKRLANYRDGIAKHTPTRFDESQKVILLDGVRDICARRDWHVHAATATPSHVHVLVSWRTQHSPSHLATPIKRLLGMMLSQHKGEKGNRWFSRGFDQTQVRDQAHFEHLMNVYLPDHVKQNGLVWIERRP